MAELTEQEKAKNAAIKACGCLCHDPGLVARHIMPCCKHSYEKPVVADAVVKEKH